MADYYHLVSKAKSNLLVLIRFSTIIKIIGILFLVWFLFFSLPSELFKAPKSRAIYDRNGHLLFASVAEDGQWRFPKIDSVSIKVEKCVTLYEDEYFFYHLGINPISILKSFFLNLKSGDIKRGGSTITMQTIRILQQNPKRTYWQKIKEIILALRFELFNSKNTILEYYVSNAPYGGNIVGIEAASWRYFGKSSQLLSWAEAATLAVLPNQPSYIYPGKNQELLLKKRNKLLKKLLENKEIDALDYQLALEERLPSHIFSIPSYSYHLAQEIDDESSYGIVNTTIDYQVQRKVMDVLEMYHIGYKSNQINNLAAIVIDANNGEIIAYVGNTSDSVGGNKINMITRPRSSGSTLKPLLYANMLDDGLITSSSLIQDIPIDINGYEPNNSSYKFDGLIPANQALSRSLNIPWILSLKKYGYDRFYKKLQDCGFSHFTKPARHYGLSLVVGGGEIELQELADVFLLMSNKLKDQNLNLKSSFIRDKYNYANDPMDMSRGAIWLTFEALTNVARPENEENWQYRQSQKIAWKTGTSHGYRDAWSVGVNPNYVIAVWVGNSEGNGRSNLTGVKKAAPIMFDILNSLPTKKSKWYSKPTEDLKTIKVCSQSGYTPTEFCEQTIDVEYPLKAESKEKCSYHCQVFLDSTATYLVNPSCYLSDKIIQKKWFKLPLVEESYFKSIHPLYKSLPPYHPACVQSENYTMELTFPKPHARIVMNTSTISNHIIFQAVHRSDSAKIHWFLDNQFLQTTILEHKVSVQPSQGLHTLTIQDNFGNFRTSKFYVERE